MSLWHSPQVSESMKKLAGMMPPTLVFADDGKKGELGPPPSPAIDTGAVAGLAMRAQRTGCVRAYSATANGSRSASADDPATPAAQVLTPPDARMPRTTNGTSATPAAIPNATCSRSAHRSLVRLP